MYYGTIMHLLCRCGQEAGIVGIMNVNSVIWGIIGLILFLVVLRVFGLN